MLLKNIMSGVTYAPLTDLKIFSTDITDIVYDSRKASPGSIFVAIKGEAQDGHKFIPDAFEKGCRIFAGTDDFVPPAGSTYIKLENSRIALSKMSANFFGHPSRELTVIGITGTKGKTTVSTTAAQVIHSCGISAGIIGTNGAIYDGVCESTSNTTPESYEIQRILRKMVNRGVKCVCMEVSSSGLMMHRTDDVEFDIGVFTNISPDHIGPGEHTSFKEYLSCKQKLFSLAKKAVINFDDTYSQNIIAYAVSHGCEIIGFALDDIGIRKGARFTAKNIVYHDKLSFLGSDFICKDKDNSQTLYSIKSPGKFSVYNALAAISICKLVGLDDTMISKAIPDVKVDGRVEILDIYPGATIILDYAHNKASLDNLLSSLKSYNPKRLICLFGSVGGRTKLRRRHLGKVASELCDFCIITSDDPGDENPEDIIDEIASAFTSESCSYIKITDRRKAVTAAINMLMPGDVLVLAGKGGDSYMRINGIRYPYSERETAREAAKARLKRESKL